MKQELERGTHMMSAANEAREVRARARTPLLEFRP